MHDKRMHLRDVNGKEVSISVDMVGTMKKLLEGEDPHHDSPKPHMVLCPEDERRIRGMMLTGWMSKADLLRGWAGQGKKKNLPPSARVEAVRRLGWRLGPGIEACRTITEGAGPKPAQAPEGGDQIRKFLEEWQQKYRESEERYRAERDEAFRSDDEVARAEEQLATERAAELKKRTKTIEQPLPIITARLGILWSEMTGSSRPVPSEIRLTSTGT